MSVKHMSYLDLSPQQRREAAATRRTHLKAMLANPIMDQLQAKVIMRQLQVLAAWEAGTIPVKERK